MTYKTFKQNSDKEFDEKFVSYLFEDFYGGQIEGLITQYKEKLPLK